ncbi:MAG: DMT family transporter [Gammaproteobacteria bacterium]|nr:hypothetical protein [Chromatiales bacterium]MDP7420059.1 DMT family transporter [Gammaproteobacteria bacterium]HJP38905.1 DMT family transporter [Gammaproteobacteria bacterium]
MTIRPLHWFILLCLALVWGSSYLMIEIALQAWQPAQITGLRILLAAMVLLAWIVFSRSRIPLDLRTWVFFLIIAVIGNCLPFFLISWGQQYVESGLAGILVASTPLVVLILSHFMLPDERLRIRHLVSFMLGFTGVVVLMGADLPMTLGGSGNRLLAQFAIIGGAICYALATVIARRMPPVSPLVTSAGVMLLASGLMTPFIVAAAAPLPEASGPAILALGFLGVMGTGVSSILYFYLINLTGARFTSLLNYLVPAWALLLGVTILGEKFPISTWFALIIILSGLALIARSDDIVPRSEG